MIINKWFVRLGIVASLGIFVWWWFVITDWLVSPRSPRAGIFYICVVLLSAGWHVRALYRFSKMTNRIRAEELIGDAEPGSTTFAANQRFRYLVRTIESLVVLSIGVCSVVAVYRPMLAVNPNYIRLILTYFVGSILLTGYLTMRDLWVLNVVQKLSKGLADEASLTSTHRRPTE